METLLSNLLSLSTLVFAVSSMLSVGLRYSIQEIIAPLRNARLVIGAVVANFVLVPILAYMITAIFSFGEEREIGLLVVACAAGAPFLIKLAQMAGADLAIATGVLVLLLVITVPYMPIVVPLIAPEADVSAATIARPLVLSMLLPLVVGLIAHRFVPAWTERLLPLLGLLANIALVALLVSTVVLNFEELLSVFGTGAILAALLFIIGAFVIGYLLGITGRGTREELAQALGIEGSDPDPSCVPLAYLERDGTISVVPRRTGRASWRSPWRMARRPCGSRSSERMVGLRST